ncbi:MBL fold metallo-hydrolase [Exiguobacterium sp. OS-77]|uniref:MBL fold metallo-hydrolase n=1 Tax=Exiguobacterium sp. OS-77 TaxID=1241306 RepID=UPI0004243D88|nr:MBL fold metallo-hydrolase [Exiguobacterium sp. OS-77]
MRVTTIERLHQLQTTPSFFPVNCYLFEEADSLTLIDAGLGINAKALYHYIRKQEKPLGAIILTHAHADHVGSLDFLANAFPLAQVCISYRDAALLSGDETLREGETTPLKGGIPKNIKTRPDRLLESGQQVGSLSVIASPGHTPGSISLWHEGSRTLIAGDAFQTQGGLAVSGDVRWQFPFPALATWDPDVALRSADQLTELSPDILAVGHGPLILGPSYEMRQAVDRFTQVLQTKKSSPFKSHT